ncbi:response regulator [Ramlibacter sp.]|uniref:response regulator n=1 Tax=Ramlibacter sp. TaxID=1917967 RepID=UPI002CEF0BE6|nr:response regulator [Ramlibacter sp.]HWI83963.1 response regulator [Ramlibacter sp.]
MTTLLIVDDDPALRSRVAQLLRQHGYQTLEAGDGRTGVELVRSERPDAVISDVTMPGLDGFGLVEAIRADAALAATPVLLLTARNGRESVRRGMTAGADDYLAKPVAPAELLDAVAALLKKQARVEDSIEAAVQARLAVLRQPIAGPSASERADEYGLAPEAGAIADRQLQATVLFADIRNFTALAEQLGSAEVAELLAAYFEHACRPALGHGGTHLKFIGDGLMTVFTDEAPATAPAARRAVAAALGIAVAAHRFRDWVERRFAGRALPPFAIGIGLHAGEVTLCRLGAGDSSEVTVIGDAVNVAARLEAASKELGWTVVASRAVLQRAGAGVQTGGAAFLALRGRSEDVEVCAVTGLASDTVARQGTARDAHAAAVRTAVDVNSALAAQAPDGSPVSVTAVRRQPRDS